MALQAQPIDDHGKRHVKVTLVGLVPLVQRPAGSADLPTLARLQEDQQSGAYMVTDIQEHFTSTHFIWGEGEKRQLFSANHGPTLPIGDPWEGRNVCPSHLSSFFFFH
jgi:hypothetical protein